MHFVIDFLRTYYLKVQNIAEAILINSQWIFYVTILEKPPPRCCVIAFLKTNSKVKLETKRNAIKFNPDPIGAQELYDGMEDDFVEEYGDEVLK